MTTFPNTFNQYENSRQKYVQKMDDSEKVIAIYKSSKDQKNEENKTNKQKRERSKNFIIF